MSILECDSCIMEYDSQIDISLNCVISTVAKIALSTLKLLFARVFSDFVQISSDFKITILVSFVATIDGAYPLRIKSQTFLSIDFMNAFTLTF